MTDLQRIVKYGAIGLAFVIIIGIAATIISGISIFFNFRNSKDQDLIETKETEITENITKLKIDIKATNLKVKSSDQFKMETNNGRIKYSIQGNNLIITEKSTNIFKNSMAKELTIYVPSDIEFDEITLDAGAGKVELLDLNTNKLDLELGAGSVKLSNINAAKEAVIDGGAGELIINNSILNNLDLDMGVGSLDLVAQLPGRNEISCGVGEVDILLIGNDYQIEIDKGIGKATISGKEIKNNEVYGTGSNELKIDGGVGSININFNITDTNTKF